MSPRQERHALVLCFNEDYTKNLEKLKSIYEHRFSQVVCIAPDHYSGLDRWYKRPANPKYAIVNGADIIINRLRRAKGRRNTHEAESPAPIEIWRVHGFKYYFQDYFWQVKDKLLDLQSDWYWFVADDLLLHPTLNEDNICSNLIRDPCSKSAICKPVFARDAWINWFHGSIDRVVESLRACGTYPLDHCQYDLPACPLGDQTESGRVISGCADFFGCHRDILTSALKRFHGLAKRKVFVEAAIPNTFLAIDPHCSFVESYEWDFADDRGSERKIEAFLSSAGGPIFYHPFKLSMLKEAALTRLIASEAK